MTSYAIQILIALSFLTAATLVMVRPRAALALLKPFPSSAFGRAVLAVSVTLPALGLIAAMAVPFFAFSGLPGKPNSSIKSMV